MAFGLSLWLLDIFTYSCGTITADLLKSPTNHTETSASQPVYMLAGN